MKTLTFLALMLVCVLAHAADYGDANVQRVTSIYDGDTFRADIAGWPPIVGQRIPVRIRGADAPEMRAHCQRERDLALAAKQFTVSALRNARHIELKNIGRDKYFRLDANVIVDGRDLGKMLIRAHLARPYHGGHRGSWCD